LPKNPALLGKQGLVVIADYFYDHQSRRMRKLVGTTTTVYHYDQDNHLVAETNGAGTLLRTYVWRGDTPVIQIESSTGQDKPYYLEVDTLNTPRTARDANGSIVWQWYADAFGNTAALEDPDGDGTATRINLRFPGQYFDQETGLHYNMTRYYNLGNGRYLQPDPIGLAGGINTYSYVGGNPVNLTDPKGLCPWCVAAVYFYLENALAINTAGIVAAELASGVPNPVSSLAFEGRVAGEAAYDVYYGYVNGERVYAGITNNFFRRSNEWAGKYELQKITSCPATKDQARGIEQSIINDNPGFNNINNSISPNRPWYQEAVDWGNQWRKANGH
jgi:RHS repeat-associated protein